MNRTDLVRCACVVRKGLTIHCGSWGLSCCLLSRAGGNRIWVPNFRTHYQFFQRFSLSLLDISLPTVDRLRALLSEDFIASNSRFLEQYPTAPKDLPTILLNSSLESTLLYYRGKGYWPSHQVRALLLQISQTKPRLLAALNQSLGPRTLSSLTSANLFFHTNPLAQIFHLLHIVTSLDL